MTTIVAKPNHTLQRVWRPVSYASTTVLEQTWRLEPKATEGYYLSEYTAAIFREIETLRDIHMPKIFRLHDGMWVNQEVSDSAIRIAETEALNTVFPGYQSNVAIFRIASLAPRFVEIRDRLSSLRPGPSLLPALPRKFAHLLTSQRPSTQFYQKFVEHQAEVKQDRYIDRVEKRPRL